MDFLVRPADAFPAIADFIRDHGAGLPATTYGALAAFEPSPAMRLVKAGEALYAAAEALPEAGLVLCAQLARLAADSCLSGLGRDGRGEAVIAACRRRLGELTSEQAPPENDPAPLPHLVPD